jgi:threonine/homoserine/homoserine lactone efflux protein
MPDLLTLGAFALASCALIVIPGPNLIYIVTRSMVQGPRAGLASAAGVETATSVYVTASTFGISALIARSDTAFATLRYAGAGYLAYLAARTLRFPPAVDADVPAAAQPLSRIYRDGAVVNLLNPKVALFFVAFLPEFVTPDASTASIRSQLLVLGTLFIALALTLDIGYALVGGALGRWLRRRGEGRLTWLRWPVGAVYLSLAVYAAVS